MAYPKRHISIRVPWHDAGWDGRVCANPRLNASCLKLKRIGQEKDDSAEEAVAGQSIENLSQKEWPCCVPERVAFMAPFEYTRTANHPYKRTSEGSHGHFDSTALRHPPYSTPAVPFGWMLRESMNELGETYGLDISADREPNLGFDTQWVQAKENQQALLDCFCEHIKLNESLCFFYTKQAPFVEDPEGRRILVGVGRVLNVSPAVEYQYTTKDLNGKLRSMLWERMVQHSIRPNFKDGFLLPYHAALNLASENPDFDPASLAAFSPEDRLLEFSHASQLVTHDGALGALLSCAESLRKAQGLLPGPWEHCLTWIDHRLGELWTARGPCPGLASALCAFGIELGTFVARFVCDKLGENVDPWPMLDQVLKAPQKHLPKDLAQGIGTTLQAKWVNLPKERQKLLMLLSRFEISREQATTIYVQEERRNANIDCSDQAILANPYLLYESTRLTSTPISLWSVDRGVFPEAIIRKSHPLPTPTALDAGTDARRVRAFTVKTLEDAAGSGNTLMPQDQVVLTIRKLDIKPECSVDGDLINVAKAQFDGTIIDTFLADGSPALQLSRLSEMGGVIRNAVNNRIKGKRLFVEADWKTLLNTHLDAYGVNCSDELEKKAREEKAAGLKELAESRFSVLVGPAGTGKTTLLSVLCSHSQITKGGILLLAPTGKARVRMEQATAHLNLKGFTVAQFLSPDRYDASTGRYRLSDKAAEVGGSRTVIVDEASMLTEEMLAALIETLKGVVHRLILIGDPRQLPPIGAGRPFVDVIKHLVPDGIMEKFPRVAPGYAELTIRRRQAGEEREDLQLAEWFSGAPQSPGEDDVFDEVVNPGKSTHVRFVQWDSPDELRERMLSVLTDELGLEGPDDVLNFEKSLGGEDWNNKMRFFNFGSAAHSESWQILSPVRSGAYGVPAINRSIHKQFRQEMINASRIPFKRKFPKPMGPEEIVYGDKVINVVNTDPKMPWNRHRKVYPEKDVPYIANGEIGIVVGFFRKKGLPDLRWKLEVEFSSQPAFKYKADSSGKRNTPTVE